MPKDYVPSKKELRLPSFQSLFKSYDKQTTDNHWRV